MHAPRRIWREQGGHNDTRVGCFEERDEQNLENAPPEKYPKGGERC